MDHSCKNESHFEKGVTLVKRGDNCKNGSHLENRVEVEIGYTLKIGLAL